MIKLPYQWSAAVGRSYLLEGGTLEQRVSVTSSLCRLNADEYEVVVQGFDAQRNGLVRFQFYEFAQDFMAQAVKEYDGSYMPLIASFTNSQKPEVVNLPSVEADYGLTPDIYETYPRVAKIVITPER